MAQRIFAGALWAFFGWYLTAHVASLAGLPLDIALLGAPAMAAIAFVDWRNLTRTVTARQTGDAAQASR
jgi:hypothetical protein